MATTDIDADPALAAWRVDDAEYPLAGTRADQLAFLVRYAVLAPSGHNAQPWTFRLAGDELELRADRGRALPAVDPEGRELVISCGAALGTLRIAARGFGLEPLVRVQPDASDLDLLAAIRLSDPVTPTGEARRLTSLIAARRTTRSPYLDRPLAGTLLADLHTIVPDERVWLRVVTRTESKRRVAALAAAGDRQQFADARFREELSAWVRPSADPAMDGVRDYGFGDRNPTGPLLARMVERGRRQTARTEALLGRAPALVVLGSVDDTPRSWLAVGEALQRLLLRLTDAGATAAFANQPIEVEALRASLAHAIDAPGFPQLLVRVGYAPELPPPEPRRPAREVLTISS